MLRRIPFRGSPVVLLFCVPHAGTGPAAFRGWAAGLVPEIDPIVVELPGRESRFHEPPYQRMEPLVRDLSDAVIDSLAEDQPFAFFGNSLGGLIAFEALHQIRRRTGREALHLFVSASSAPGCEPVLPPISHLEDRELVREIEARYGAIPAPVLNDSDFLSSLLPTLRADIRLFETYRWNGGESLSCPITAYAGRFDRSVPQENVDAWKGQTSNTFRSLFLNDGHMFLQSCRDYLVRDLRNALLLSETRQGVR